MFSAFTQWSFIHTIVQLDDRLPSCFNFLADFNNSDECFYARFVSFSSLLKSINYHRFYFRFIHHRNPFEEPKKPNDALITS